MAKGNCSIEGCKNPARTRGWCPTHYRRWRIHGDPLIAAKHSRGTPFERLMSRAISTPGPLGTDCWTCDYSTKSNGYVRLSPGALYAHRVAYEALVGPIPEGLDIDHLCRNPACFNPAHLEPVTHRVNVLRGTHPLAVLWRTNTCKRGLHSLDDAYLSSNGSRRCRQCTLDLQRAAYIPKGDR